MICAQKLYVYMCVCVCGFYLFSFEGSSNTRKNEVEEKLEINMIFNIIEISQK